ncbi:MAG: hypothetical protein HOV68_12975 [Streptomycetaceae bacterium]|nr:hypothetical protein [Streptomycetaceae bacterium]
MINRRARSIGMDGVHAHRWRRSFAHQWKRAGGDTGDLAMTAVFLSGLDARGRTAAA